MQCRALLDVSRLLFSLLFLSHPVLSAQQHRSRANSTHSLSCSLFVPSRTVLVAVLFPVCVFCDQFCSNVVQFESIVGFYGDDWCYSHPFFLTIAFSHTSSYSSSILTLFLFLFSSSLPDRITRIHCAHLHIVHRRTFTEPESELTSKVLSIAFCVCWWVRGASFAFILFPYISSHYSDFRLSVSFASVLFGVIRFISRWASGSCIAEFALCVRYRTMGVLAPTITARAMVTQTLLILYVALTGKIDMNNELNPGLCKPIYTIMSQTDQKCHWYLPDVIRWP